MLIHHFLTLRTLLFESGQYLISTQIHLKRSHGNTLVLIYQTFFNFGLDEEKWKDFCKQLVSLLFTFAVCNVVFIINSFSFSYIHSF
jgi:hypothetical protein